MFCFDKVDTKEKIKKKKKGIGERNETEKETKSERYKNEDT